MNEEKFDELFRKKLEAVSPEYDEAAWEALEQRLPPVPSPVVPLPAGSASFWRSAALWLALIGANIFFWWHQERRIDALEDRLSVQKDTLITRDTVWIFVQDTLPVTPPHTQRASGAVADRAALLWASRQPATIGGTAANRTLGSHTSGSHPAGNLPPATTSGSGIDTPPALPGGNSPDPASTNSSIVVADPSFLATTESLTQVQAHGLLHPHLIPLPAFPLMLADTLPFGYALPVKGAAAAPTGAGWWERLRSWSPRTQLGIEGGVMFPVIRLGEAYPLWNTAVTGRIFVGKRLNVFGGLAYSRMVYEIDDFDELPLATRLRFFGYQDDGIGYEVAEVYTMQWQIPLGVGWETPLSKRLALGVQAGGTLWLHTRQQFEYYQEGDDDEHMNSAALRSGRTAPQFGLLTGGAYLDYRPTGRLGVRLSANIAHTMQKSGYERQRWTAFGPGIGAIWNW